MGFFEFCDTILHLTKDKSQFQFQDIHKNLDLTKTQFGNVIIRLRRDDYLQDISRGLYAINSKGIQFINQGGYRASNREEKLLGELPKTLLKEESVRQIHLPGDHQRTRLLAWIGAITGLAALLIELMNL